MSYGDAYFYRPSKIDPALLTGFTHVIGQSWDESVMAKLIDVQIEARYAIAQIEGPTELTRANITITDTLRRLWTITDTWRNGPIYKLIEFVQKYHPNESWFLHDSTGKRLYSVQSGRYFYLIRPKFAAKQFWIDVAAIHKQYGWQDVFIDNDGLWSDAKIEEVTDGPAQEYAGGDQRSLYMAEWDAFHDQGRLTMPAGTLIFVNAIGDWFAEQKIDVAERVSRVDGVMLEAYAPWLVMRKDFTPEHSVNIVKRAQGIVDAGKHLICVIHLSSKDTPERVAYETARYLLIAGQKTSMRLVVDGVYSGSPIKPPVFDLGKPLGPFRQRADGGLVRDFEQAQLFVDPVTYSYAIAKRQEPVPDPIDDLKQEVAALKIERQYDQDRITDLETKLEAQGKTVAELQQRFAQPITFSGTIKI